MNDDEKKLIEEMVELYEKGYGMTDVLDLVKQNIGAVAKVCPECGGNSGLGDSCPRCKDVGVVSK